MKNIERKLNSVDSILDQILNIIAKTAKRAKLPFWTSPWEDRNLGVTPSLTQSLIETREKGEHVILTSYFLLPLRRHLS